MLGMALHPRRRSPRREEAEMLGMAEEEAARRLPLSWTLGITLCKRRLFRPCPALPQKYSSITAPVIQPRVRPTHSCRRSAMGLPAAAIVLV